MAVIVALGVEGLGRKLRFVSPKGLRGARADKRFSPLAAVGAKAGWTTPPQMMGCQS